MLQECCSVNTNFGDDTFVGIRYENNKLEVKFPLGFALSTNDKEIRKDILLLLSVLMHNTEQKESKIPLGEADKVEAAPPIQAYLYLLRDYFMRGYYKESNIEYTSDKKGKISWSRTVKEKKPYVQGTDFFYLDFITRKSNLNENELISQIHQYCVYESFLRLGWLFSTSMPTKPALKFNKKIFLMVINNKLHSTFKDSDKNLFLNMLAIVNDLDDQSSSTSYRFGTNRFEYIWERMIDTVFGIKNKSDYFPKTYWNIAAKGGTTRTNAPLEPDTIMVHGSNVYVLDAKYYKYGYTGHAADLPETASINKQITYGEYIYTNPLFKTRHGADMEVYNAFLLPFDSHKWETEALHYIGSAVSDWKKGRYQYETIKAVLVDVKYLMALAEQKNRSKIAELAQLLENS